MSGGIKERPILFSGEMVRAILDGRKTQTRRVIKCDHRVLRIVEDDDGVWMAKVAEGDEEGQTGWEYDRIKQPPATGDRLWVRETWSASSEHLPVHRPSPDSLFWYRADNDRPTWAEGRWKPSIHMPRWASRILLEVVDVWPEPLRDITDEEAYREGVEMVEGPKNPEYGVPGLAPTFKHYQNPEFNGGRGVGVRHSFQTLWDSINAGRGFGWDVNPWVWVVEFKVIEGGHS